MTNKGWYAINPNNQQTNNPRQHYSFICIQLNASKYSYVSLTVQLNISHLLYTVIWSNSSISNNSIQYKPFVCTYFKCQTVLLDPQVGPYHVAPLRTRVYMGAMAIKGYSEFPKFPKLESNHKMFNVISGYSVVVVVDGSVTVLQNFSVCILQTQPTGLAIRSNNVKAKIDKTHDSKYRLCDDKYEIVYQIRRCCKNV